MPPSQIVFHWDFCVSFRYRATTPNVEADWTCLFWEPMVRDAFLTIARFLQRLGLLHFWTYLFRSRPGHGHQVCFCCSDVVLCPGQLLHRMPGQRGTPGAETRVCTGQVPELVNALPAGHPGTHLWGVPRYTTRAPGPMPPSLLSLLWGGGVRKTQVFALRREEFLCTKVNYVPN